MKQISLKELISEKDLGILLEDMVFVYPTDTVYGIGGDPFNINVVSRVVHLKKRVIKPFPILVSRKGSVYKIASVGDLGNKFIKRFWPGSLTIVFPSKMDIPALLGNVNIGIRMPSGGNLLSMIEFFNGFLIGTSANISGYPPATTIKDAVKYFKGSVDVYVYDDSMISGLPSTAIYINEQESKVIVLRCGALNITYLKSFCDEIGCVINVKC